MNLLSLLEIKIENILFKIQWVKPRGKQTQLKKSNRSEEGKQKITQRRPKNMKQRVSKHKDSKKVPHTPN